MEYLKLIRKFWSFVKECPLNTSAISLYLFLLQKWDVEGQKDFEFSDIEINRKLKMDRNTIRKNKDILRNLGLISYQITNGYPTFYKIILDYSVRKSNKELPVAEKKKVSQEVIVPSIDTPPTIEVPPTASSVATPPPKKSKPKLNIEPPTLEEFMEYAKTLELYEESLIPHLKTKYETWNENNWVNGYGKPILNWKLTLKSTMPYLKNSNQGNIFNIPKINRPKSTYNE
ncbi:transcriptional regulator [uncultured Capnocytophaga sp.]|uniref:transcriptional regulator n=1 Tax=uncultured Capnocytophaga sp. TaxID=159273 RepID=UPI0026222562|nr:transcriptional regulator [uncultured Capnocytophaga sp.]